MMIERRRDLINSHYGCQEETPLHGTVAYDQVEIARYLIMQGANPFARNTNGYTPLDLARYFYHHEIIPILREAEKAQNTVNMVRNLILHSIWMISSLPL